MGGFAGCVVMEGPVPSCGSGDVLLWVVGGKSVAELFTSSLTEASTGSRVPTTPGTVSLAEGVVLVPPSWPLSRCGLGWEWSCKSAAPAAGAVVVRALEADDVRVERRNASAGHRSL